MAEPHDRRDVPGGPTPARTPGATGPSTRDTERAVADDANESLVGRVRIAPELSGGK